MQGSKKQRRAKTHKAWENSRKKSKIQELIPFASLSIANKQLLESPLLVSLWNYAAVCNAETKQLTPVQIKISSGQQKEKHLKMSF